MKKFSVALLALAAALAISPAAMADTFNYTYTGVDGVVATGTLTGSNIGGNQFGVTSGTITISGSGLVTGSGVLIGGTGFATSPNGAFNYDNFVFVPVSDPNAYVDSVGGLLFQLDSTPFQINIFSGVWDGNEINPPFGGKGTDTYSIWEGTSQTNYNYHNVGDLTITPTPEPGSLFLLGTGLLGLALILFRKAKPATGFMTLS